ncbi:hypothetical protein M426DRAFT_102470 [Hypoxylon sp. CI-4A]|nr:hypothetical protein M426DRAFT_102470 [Hypoxylon sp. CI-4A]
MFIWKINHPSYLEIQTMKNLSGVVCLKVTRCYGNMHDETTMGRETKMNNHVLCLASCYVKIHLGWEMSLFPQPNVGDRSTPPRGFGALLVGGFCPQHSGGFCCWPSFIPYSFASCYQIRGKELCVVFKLVARHFSFSFGGNHPKPQKGAPCRKGNGIILWEGGNLSFF